MSNRVKRKVTVVSCVFPPELVVSGITTREVVKGLATNGHSVKVVTSFPSRPGGRIFSGYRRRLYSHCAEASDFDLVRCFSIPTSESSAVRRFVENITFGLSSAVYLLFSSRPDVIYSNSWPVFATGLMSLVAVLRRIPYVIIVQDIYPESYAVQGRASQKSLTFGVMRWIDGQVSRRSAHVIVISPSFAKVYTEDRQVPTERVSVIPNWADQDALPASEAETASLRERFAIPQQAFLVAYGGNIGMAAGVETLVKAFSYLDGEVYGLVAGEGSQLAACQKLAVDIQRLSFFTPWPANQTMPLYQAADVLVLPTLGNQSMASVPSKLIRYMLSGRPVIAAGLPGSELASVIEASGSGWLVEPDEPAGLAEKIHQVKSLQPSELEQRGEAGRRFALENLTSQACLPRVIEIIERAVQ